MKPSGEEDGMALIQVNHRGMFTEPEKREIMQAVTATATRFTDAGGRLT